MNYKFFAKEIKETVKFPELLDFYGIETDHAGRMPCIFHNGTDNNLGFKNNYCHCFVCGAGGDIIKFTQQYFDISFIDAIEKLNRDFNVGLPIGSRMTLRQKYQIEDTKKKRELEKLEKQKKDELIMTDWENAGIEWERLNQNFNKYKPKSENEALHPLFVEALQKLGFATYRAEQTETRMILNAIK